MRPLSEATSRIAKANFSRKYIALGKIVNCWEQIVGPDLADKAQPVKVGYRQQRTRKDKPSASLEIACSSAYATTLHYQKDLILERMNAIFGERWITELKFVPAEKMQIKAMRRKRVQKSLDEADLGYIKELLADIPDVEIKQRLESLGHNIMMDE